MKPVQKNNNNNDFAIRVSDVTKRFKPLTGQGTIKATITNIFGGKSKPVSREYTAVKDISFEVKKGEFFGIVGRNGSGKSTLLKIIAGVYTPTQGSVEVRGRIVPFIELGVGFNPELSGRDNVFLNGAMLGFSRKEMANMYDEIVGFAELHDHMDVKLKNFSSGMQVRLAFSIAIRAKSEILLIDEVLAVGDAAFQRKCFQFFKDIKKDGRTVVLVTHDMGVIQQYCDRAMMIEDSEVLTIGAPRQVALRYEVQNLEGGLSDKKSSELNTGKHQNSDLIIAKVSISGNRDGSFELNDELSVRVKLSSKKDIETPVQLNIFLTKPDGSYLAGFNTTGDLGKLMIKKGESIFTCDLASGQIPKGEYRVGVGVYTYEQPAVLYDIIDPSNSIKSPYINIVEKSLTQDGSFYLRAKWRSV